MEIQTNETFKCNACGSCCSHIRGFIPKQDKEFLKENVFGKLPVVQLVPIEKMTFPLWDWEAKRFLEWEKEVNANIKPLRALFDLNSNKAIILTYFMDSETDACPFLKDNKCLIYHTKRAYICRLFPFNKSQFDDNTNSSELFGDCGAMEKILPVLPKEKDELIKFLKNTFPDGEFLNAIQNDLIIEWSNKIIIDLIRKKLIRPAMNYPYEFLLKRINNSEKIDFSEFLTESGYIEENEMKKLIKRFDENLDAKENIEK